MASVATVVTMGYGSFGSVNLLPTLGYGIGNEPIAERTFCVQAVDSYLPGAVRIDSYVAGATETDNYLAGAVRTDGDC